MKSGIHPELKDATVECACGNVIKTRSLLGDFKVDICNVCHPFYTGKQKLLDTRGASSATAASTARSSPAKTAARGALRLPPCSFRHARKARRDRDALRRAHRPSGAAGNRAEPKLMRELGKEHAELTKVVSVYRELKALRAGIADSKEILANERDPEMQAMAKEELVALEKKSLETEERLKLLLLPKDPNDDRNVIVEIRAGTGGDEAALFAGELFRMYTSSPRRAATRSRSCLRRKAAAAAKRGHLSHRRQRRLLHLQVRVGVHRVQRVPETESQGRIHTSA